LRAQTKEIDFNGESINMRSIEEILDTSTEDEIIEMMTKNDEVDWTILAALQVYVDTANLFPIKNDENWLSTLAIEQKKLDTAHRFLSMVTHKLRIKKILTSSISEEWKSMKDGHNMYSIKRLTSGGTETQYFISNGEYHSFISLEDAERFLELYQAIYDIITVGKFVRPDTILIVIIVEKVIKRMEINR